MAMVARQHVCPVIIYSLNFAECGENHKNPHETKPLWYKTDGIVTTGCYRSDDLVEYLSDSKMMHLSQTEVASGVRN